MNREEQFAQLVATYKSSIWRVCYTYVHDRSFAEDVYQDTLIEIWNGLEKFRGESGWHTWIYRIAVNTAIRHGRIEQKRPVAFTEQPKDIAETHSDGPEMEARIAQLHRCISKLQEQDRLLISLVLEDLSYKEIADITGLTVNHVGVRINRIKPRLHDCISSAE